MIRQSLILSLLTILLVLSLPFIHPIFHHIYLWQHATHQRLSILFANDFLGNSLFLLVIAVLVPFGASWILEKISNGFKLKWPQQTIFLWLWAISIMVWVLR